MIKSGTNKKATIFQNWILDTLMSHEDAIEPRNFGVRDHRKSNLDL